MSEINNIQVSIDIFKSVSGKYYAELFGQYFPVDYDYTFERNIFLRTLVAMYNTPEKFESIKLPKQSVNFTTVHIVGE